MARSRVKHKQYQNCLAFFILRVTAFKTLALLQNVVNSLNTA